MAVNVSHSLQVIAVIPCTHYTSPVSAMQDSDFGTGEVPPSVIWHRIGDVQPAPTP
ncbi:MAG: hypothetical protein ACETWR_09085 [Anaerolineae bacterium]